MYKKILLQILFLNNFFLSEAFICNAYASLSRPSIKHTKPDTLETSLNCQAIISHFEKKYDIPEGLLNAIATVESKKSPWAINAKKRSFNFKTKEDALKYIQKLQSQGVKNINVGCMQINLPSHRKQFKSLSDILTPYHNIAFAAKLFKNLYQHHGSWTEAIRYYHSGSSSHNIPYKNRVYSVWGHKNNEFLDTTNFRYSQYNLKNSSVKIIIGPAAGITRKK